MQNHIHHSTGNYFLPALTIRVSDSETAVAQCNFHSPRKHLFSVNKNSSMIHLPYVSRSDYLAITDQCPACHFIFVLVHLKDPSIWDCGLILMFYPSRFSLEMISGYRSCNLNEQLTLSNSHWGKQFVATFSFSVHCNFCFEMNLREIHFLASKFSILNPLH